MTLTAALPARAQWDGFDRVIGINSGLGNAGFQIDFAHAAHFHVSGAAAGDVDGDGHADLVLVRGDHSPRLYRNRGDGSFSDATAAAGLTGHFDNQIPNGVLLADINGDDALDVLFGGVPTAQGNPTTPMRLFLNDGDGVFAEATAASGLASPLDAHSMALADINGNGRLDLAVAYWQAGGSGSNRGHLWRNLGDAEFEDISEDADVVPADPDKLYHFTPNFTDLDGDGDPDLVMAADFGNSRVFVNNGDDSFSDVTDAEKITDENGMGAAVGDFDNDGDMDWFVTSIWAEEAVCAEDDEDCQEPYGNSGNRLYRNDGDGVFTDATDAAGVRAGDWGWGACAADFNNDGWLDLFMVNGYQPATHGSKFRNNPARLFISNGVDSNGDVSFSEQAAAMNIDTANQGRAVVCFDSNNNGQVDVLVQNSNLPSGPRMEPEFFRNLGAPDHHWLRVRLKGPAPNTRGVGARVTVEVGGHTQVREIRAGNNFLSSDPIEAHFGLGDSDEVERLSVRWPDGTVREYGPVGADRIVEPDYANIFSDRFTKPSG